MTTSNNADTRCEWARSELAKVYHDHEWGKPCYDERTLFEFLILEGAQAGLSWETILKKRDHYREVYENFDPARVARFTPKRQQKLLADPGIVRNRLKVESSIDNARAFLNLQDDFGSAGKFLWSFVDPRTHRNPIVNARRSLRQIPPRTSESDAMSKALKARGFRFVGSTICYAFMQAVGMVNDHLVTCPRYTAVQHRSKKPTKAGA